MLIDIHGYIAYDKPMKHAPIKMKKITSSTNLRGFATKYLVLLCAGIIIVLTAGYGWLWYRERSITNIPDPVFPNHTIPYVDGSTATDQVEAFYQQYLNPRTPARDKLIGLYGSHNLVFYSQYYQHGFNPITCSTVDPTKVVASLVSTGPVAHVKATASYANGATADILTTVVLNDNGIQIDSITCPGDKGNLFPE